MRSRALAVALTVAGTAAVMASQAVVVAEVAGRTITRDQFQSWLEDLRAQDRYAHSVETVTPDGQKRLLDRLVTARLFAEAARAEGAAADSQEALAAGYEQRVLAGLTETDVRQYYDRHPDLFRTGGRVRASHILVHSRAEADAVAADLEAGKRFGEVARTRSVDATTAPAGGDLGWVPRGVMVKPFEDALFALNEGEVSGAVETRQGFHFIRADAVDTGPVLPYAAVQNLARAALSAERIAIARASLAERFGARTYPQRLAEGTR